MDDDEPEYRLNLDATARRYAELYPSMAPRLRQILASRDPKLRRRIGVLVKAIAAADAGRLQRLKAAYRLSPAEARLALHIIDGGSIASYADLTGVTPGTARVQLKSVFAKTGVSRQAELVKRGQTEL